MLVPQCWSLSVSPSVLDPQCWTLSVGPSVLVLRRTLDLQRRFRGVPGCVHKMTGGMLEDLIY